MPNCADCHESEPIDRMTVMIADGKRIGPLCPMCLVTNIEMADWLDAPFTVYSARLSSAIKTPERKARYDRREDARLRLLLSDAKQRLGISSAADIDQSVVDAAVKRYL